ncbi:hypothetical protein F1C58_16260 (plasmid) [Glaciihabitans sp. INWT7]|uniref:hypothetical protein n=1 Tax=Glaciihabitans sp. INWT7 TaxID=2596912 RepID=UPI0016266D07|nr:hypothetical protein [Glaciihabitans sp. INWT7]QNE48613.1 hypothetical protein F1C58_16260 [Glaciihabitans sp. INWT7]
MTTVAAVLALTLAGCSGLLARPKPSPEARTTADVTRAIEAIPGVALVQIGGGPDGLPGQNEINARIIVEPELAPATDQLLDYVLRQMWSQNKTHISTLVSISFFIGTADAPTAAERADLAPALTKLGFTGYDSDPTRIRYLGYGLGASEMSKHYSAWPGPVPVLPSGLAVPSAAPNVEATP